MAEDRVETMSTADLHEFWIIIDKEPIIKVLERIIGRPLIRLVESVLKRSKGFKG